MKARGQGTARDVASATQKLAALAQQGEAAAALSLGEFYGKGDEAVRPDPARTAEYYRQAAALGSVAALLRLGDLYSGNRGVSGWQARWPYASRAQGYGEGQGGAFRIGMYNVVK